MTEAVTAIALLAGGTFAWATAALTPISSVSNIPEVARPMEEILLVHCRSGVGRRFVEPGRLL
jgi:hypothetical protein